LNQQNRERQRLTQQVQAEAEALAMREDPEAYLLFAAHESFNSGIVGLAASRLVDKYYRPAIVAERGPETTRGSCRSIQEFHITEALDQCKDLLVRHGGHAAAAGFTVENDKLPELVARLKTIAAEKLSGLDLRPSLTADAEVSLHDLPPDIMRRLSELEPTGYGNREAVLVSRAVRVASKRTVGADAKHLKLTLESGGKQFDAIAFRLGERLNDLPAVVDVMYTLETNTWNGRESLQLNIKDIKPTGVED
ncbi:MAG: DHHA1 domain-containing protein, partial [Anaerolineales bacterium]